MPDPRPLPASRRGVSVGPGLNAVVDRSDLMPIVNFLVQFGEIAIGVALILDAAEEKRQAIRHELGRDRPT